MKPRRDGDDGQDKETEAGAAGASADDPAALRILRAGGHATAARAASVFDVCAFAVGILALVGAGFLFVPLIFAGLLTGGVWVESEMKEVSDRGATWLAIPARLRPRFGQRLFKFHNQQPGQDAPAP